MSRRTLLRATGIGALAATLPVTGCAGADSGRTTIRFFQNKPEVRGYFGRVIEEFNAAQSQIHVVHDSSVGSLVPDFVREDPPDLACYNYHLESATYIATGQLTDLADLPQAGAIAPQYQELVGQFANYRGETSVLPYSVTAAGVLYNKRLFAEHGQQVPTTWSELDGVCRAFTAAGITPLYSTYSTIWTLAQGLFDYGTGGAVDVARFYDDLRAGRTSFSEAMGPAVERMLAFAAYSNPDAASRTYADGNLAMGSGEAAMYLQGPWALGEIAKVDPDLELGTFALPITDDPADTRARVNLDLALWIPRASRQQDAAREFLAHLMSPEVITRYNAENLAFSPLVGAPALTDERVSGLQPYLDDARFYQGASTYIHPLIAIGNYMQEAVITGDGPALLRTLDADWQRLAARSAGPFDWS